MENYVSLTIALACFSGLWLAVACAADCLGVRIARWLDATVAGTVDE
ncbi:MAG: hypothetical protein IJ544_04405 [Prevotella sp.]|nr:hypothetical protein [Prevotella sp.]